MKRYGSGRRCTDLRSPFDYWRLGYNVVVAGPIVNAGLDASLIRLTPNPMLAFRTWVISNVAGLMLATQSWKKIKQMKYYDLKKHWRRVRPHLADKKLNNILVRDFNKFTFGRWGRNFTHDDLPSDFEFCDWRHGKRGRPPAFWSYTSHLACHWLVNFNLRLAMLVMPDKPWRIVTSAEHSTVWDGNDLIFDFNFQAFGIDPNECFDSAYHRELPPGEYRRLYWPEHYTKELQRQQMVLHTSAIAGPVKKAPAASLPTTDHIAGTQLEV